MKKILAFVLAIAAVLTMTGCMGTASKPTNATDPAEPDKIVHTNYSDNLEGLCDYLNDLGYMVFDYDASKDEAGKATIKMQADMIGAEKGYKSSYYYGRDQWAVEVYYYKDTNSDMYKEAQTGTFVLTEDIDNGSFEITVSGKYAIVVHQPKNGDERKAKIIEAFKDFYPAAK